MLQEQPFDSAVFGAVVVRFIEPAGFTAELQDDWRQRRIWLVSCRIPSHEELTVGRRLLDAGFRRIEGLVTLERDFSDIPPVSAHSVNRAEADDIAVCQSIARSAFVYSRYNRDPEVNPEHAVEFKARWVENAIRGRADAAFVERQDGRVRGFNFCLLHHEMAVIDLIAVETAAEGEGIGKALIRHALNYYRSRARRMRVGTQLENERSLAVYSSCGFREVSRAVTYHWINRDAAP